jgi:hypothetical protein
MKYKNNQGKNQKIIVQTKSRNRNIKKIYYQKINIDSILLSEHYLSWKIDKN